MRDLAARYIIVFVIVAPGPLLAEQAREPGITVLRLAWVPGHRRGVRRTVRLVDYRDRDRRARIATAVRAVRFRLGGMFLAALRQYRAQALDADDGARQDLVLANLRDQLRKGVVVGGSVASRWGR